MASEEPHILVVGRALGSKAPSSPPFAACVSARSRRCLRRRPLAGTHALQTNLRRAAEGPHGVAERDREYRRWLKAVERTMGWIDTTPSKTTKEQ
jgi:hypothetical protein